MPYVVRKNGERWCVYKEGDDGNPAGDTLGCHDTEEEAQAQLRALYASEPEATKAVRKKEADGEHPASHYLIVEDPEAPSTWHLRVRDMDGVPDHRLMGAAWAALHEGYRGNRYEGPDKEEAIAKLRRLYKREGLDPPGSKSADIVPEDTLVISGGAVKALGDGRLGGYLVRFGSPDEPDLEGEFFAPDTDFGNHVTTPVLYQHGMDKVLRRRVLDDDASLSIDDVGVWVEAQLGMRDAYERYIYEQAEKGKMGWSSGTASHLVEREPVGKAMKITSWPLGLDASLTPTPAEPRNVAVPLKTWTPVQWSPEASPEGGADTSPAVAVVPDAGDIGHAVLSTRSMTMDTNTVPETAPSAMDSELKALSARVEEIMHLMEDSPAIRKAGYVSQDGGAGDRNVKSFGDFLTAVRRGDMKRIETVYRTGPDTTKTMTEDEGTTGGILVPEEYRTDLLRVADIASPILGLVQRIPVNSDAGRWPALDEFVAPTAGVGDTATAGGIKATIRAEAADYDTTEAAFTWLQWRVHEIGGLVAVSKELATDSPAAIETLLRQLFGIAVAHKLEHYILRGTGVGQPLGVLNAPCAVGISPDVNSYFGYADALEMVSRFLPVTDRVRWAMHQTLIPDLGTWEIGTAGAAAPKITDLGYGEPVKSQHLPPADSAGCIVLGDWGTYLLLERSGLTVAYSEHFYFGSGNVAWRFDQRCDGMPWLKSYVTLADSGGSTTVSPFVYFND